MPYSISVYKMIESIRVAKGVRLSILLYLLQCTLPAVAQTTITFEDSVQELSPSGFTTNVSKFRIGKEFRMIDRDGNITGGAPLQKNIFEGGERWVFDAQGVFVDVDLNDGQAAGSENLEKQLNQKAEFFTKDFVFRAPYKGSSVADEFGVGRLSITDNMLTFVFPVLKAEWTDIAFPLGRGSGGVVLSGFIMNRHHFTVFGEEIIDELEAQNRALFTGWAAQWALQGMINRTPIATDHTRVLRTDSQIDIPISALGTDADHDELHVAQVIPVAGSAGELDCTQRPGWCSYYSAHEGEEIIQVTLTDGFGGEVASRITFITKENNAAPFAYDDEADVAQGAQVTIDVLANDDDDHALQPQSIEIVSPAMHGAITLLDDGSIVYLANEFFTGSDALSYRVFDDGSPGLAMPSNVATLHITVHALVHQPTVAQQFTLTPGLTGAMYVTPAQLLEAGVGEDPVLAQMCEPHCVDLVVSNVTEPSVVVVIPLQGEVPAEGVLRVHDVAGWRDFDVTGVDTLRSSSGALGGCPPAGDGSYQVPVQPGHHCIELTLHDNGPNDVDAVSMRVAALAGFGVGGGVTSAVSGQAQDSSGGGGCSVRGDAMRPRGWSLDWWLCCLFVVLVTALRRVHYKN